MLLQIKCHCTLVLVSYASSKCTVNIAFHVKKIMCSISRLSESCSHVGAVLFAVEAGVKMRATCTSEQCKWLMPSHVKKVSQKAKCRIKNVILGLHVTVG